MFHGQANQHTHIMYTHISVVFSRVYVYKSTQKEPIGVNTRVEMYKLQ